MVQNSRRKSVVAEIGFLEVRLAAGPIVTEEDHYFVEWLLR